MSDNGKPKKTIRGSSEFWEDYDEFVESSQYNNRSDAARAGLKAQMQNSKEGSFNKEFYEAFATYASGLADRNPMVAGAGLDMLYNIDEDLGKLAEKELEKIE